MAGFELLKFGSYCLQFAAIYILKVQKDSKKREDSRDICYICLYMGYLSVFSLYYFALFTFQFWIFPDMQTNNISVALSVVRWSNKSVGPLRL